MLGSAVISALNGALTKILSEDISALEIIFFRNLIGVFIILSTLKHTALKLIGDNFPDMLTIMGIIFIIFGGILVSIKSQVKS